MKNGKLITLVIACITFISGLAIGNILNYHNEKKSSSSSSVTSSIESETESTITIESVENNEENIDSCEEYTESHVENFTPENNTKNIIDLLNIMVDTEYKTVKVNGTSYNIIGYIESNESNNFIIGNGLVGTNINYARDNIKALVLLDTPVTYIDEHNKSHTLESYRWLAYITDNYNSANLVTCAAVGEDGTIFTDIDYRYNDGVSIACVKYESLINQGIIEENTHWSVE